MRVSELAGLSIAMILVDLEGDATTLIYGRVEGTEASPWFVEDGTGHRLELTREQLDRIRPPEAEQREIIAPAEMFFSMYVAPQPAGADPAEYVRTGFRLQK